MNIKNFNIYLLPFTQGGQSLFEVVFAIGVAAVVLVGVVSLSTVSVRNTDFSKNNAIATKYAQEGGEWLRQKRDESWTNFIDSFTSSGYINLGDNFVTSSPAIDTVFSRRFKTTCNILSGASVTPTACGPGSSANSVDVFIEVYWTDGNGTHTVNNVTTLTSWRY